MIADRIDRMMHSCRRRGFRPTSLALGRTEAQELALFLQGQRAAATPGQSLQGARYRDCPIDLVAAASFLRVESVWVDPVCEAEYLVEPARTLEQEIAMTTRHGPAEAKRLAAALAAAPSVVVSHFRALSAVGCYSVDELVERIHALRQLAR